MLDHTLSAAALFENGQTSHSGDALDVTSDIDHRLGLALPTMVDARVRNAQAPWDDFSSEKYYDHNYKEIQAEDQEILHRVSLFFAGAFAGRKRAECAIDVGSGTNLYPALLMLPWANHILLTDYSPPNVSWLDREVRAERSPWAWEPFWQELKGCPGLRPHRRAAQAAKRSLFQGSSVRRNQAAQRIRLACGAVATRHDVLRGRVDHRGIRGIPRGHREVRRRTSIDAPFAATFMAESVGYEVDGTKFPASLVTTIQVRECFEEFGAHDLTVDMTETTSRGARGIQRDDRGHGDSRVR